MSLIIAIDGPAASGKGTLARRLADYYHLAFLDTGLTYRAVAAAMLARDAVQPAFAAAGDRAGARCRAAVTVVLPEGDRVVDPARTAAVASERGWQVVRVPEGHTPTTATGAALRWAAIRRALIEVPRQT